MYNGNLFQCLEMENVLAIPALSSPLFTNFTDYVWSQSEQMWLIVTYLKLCLQ